VSLAGTRLDPVAPLGAAQVVSGDLEADQGADGEDDHAQRVHVHMLTPHAIIFPPGERPA